MTGLSILSWTAHLLLLVSALLCIKGASGSHLWVKAGITAILFFFPILWSAVSGKWNPPVNSVSAVRTGLILMVLSFVLLGHVTDFHSDLNITNVHGTYHGIFQLLVHFIFSVFVSLWVAGRVSLRQPADIGIIALLIHGALNGGYFTVGRDRHFLLLFGFAMTSFLLWIEVGHYYVIRALKAITWPIVLLLVVLLLSTYQALDIHRSLEGFIRLFTWGVAFFITASIRRSPSGKDGIILTFVAMAGLISLDALIGVGMFSMHTTIMDGLRSRIRVGGLHANVVSVYLVANIFMLLGLFAYPSRYRFRRGIVALMIVPIVLAFGIGFSRAAFFGLFMGVLVTLWFLVRGRRSGLIIGVLIPVVVVAIVLLSGLRSFEGEFTSRLLNWRCAAEGILARPLFGIGLLASPQTQHASVLSFHEFHNIRPVYSDWNSLPIEIAQSIGVLGLCVFLWLLIKVVWDSLRRLMSTTAGSDYFSVFLLASLTAQVAALSISNPLSATTLIPLELWITMGLIISLSNRTIGPIPHTESHVAVAKNEFTPRGIPSRGVWSLLTCVMICLFFLRPALSHECTRRARTAVQKADLSRAFTYYNYAYRMSPLDADLQFEISNHLDIEDGAYMCKRAAELKTKYSPYHTQAAWYAWARNDVLDAIIEFTRAVEYDPYGYYGGRAYAGLGIVLSSVGLIHPALSAFGMAILIDPTIISSPDWRMFQGDPALSPVYTRYHQTGKIDKHLRRLIRYHLGRMQEIDTSVSERDVPRIRLNMIIENLESKPGIAGYDSVPPVILSDRLIDIYSLWRMERHLERAIERRESAVQPGTQAEERHLGERIDRLLDKGRFQEAFRISGEMVNQFRSPDSWYYRGRVQRARGNTKAAIDLLRRAASSWDSSTMFRQRWTLYWNELARAYVEHGNLLAAHRSYRMARFLLLPHGQYWHGLIDIAHEYGLRGDMAHQAGLSMHVLREIAESGGDGNRDNQVILTRIADEMINISREANFALSDALRWQHGLIQLKGPVISSYLSIFRENAAGVLPP